MEKGSKRMRAEPRADGAGPSDTDELASENLPPHTDVSTKDSVKKTLDDMLGASSAEEENDTQNDGKRSLRTRKVAKK